MSKFMFMLFSLLLTASAFAANPKDFTVESPTDGSKFTLSEHKGKVVVLHFLLKTECPYCIKHTHQYAKLASESPDVLHIFLKPDDDKDIKAWAENLSKEDLKKLPSIYRDPDAKLAKQFDIRGGYKFHGLVVNFPALVALDKNGNELFRYVGKSNSDRMAVSDFSAKLKDAMEKSTK